MRQSAGKTSIIVGLAKALGKRIGYMKPYGDRLIYRKKQLWDYDAALMATIFGLHTPPAEMTIGFDPSKLRYMYDEESIGVKLGEIMTDVGEDKDILFVEAGKELGYGTSVHLDALSLGRYLRANLIVVVSGHDHAIMDDLAFLAEHIRMEEVDFGGVVINKVHDVEDFKTAHYSHITEMGIKVLGIIPYQDELTHFSVASVAERLFAKVLTAEEGVDNVVENIVVGAMSTTAALRYPPFQKENKLVITGGDRSDMILACMETNTAGIVLTGNIMPTPNMISKAREHNIPLLLVAADTFHTAKQIEAIESLLTAANTEQIALWENLIKENVRIDEIATGRK